MKTKEKENKVASSVYSLPSEIADLQSELLATVLKKTGVEYDLLIETAKREFVASNLDVLSKTELKKFEKVLF
jgi:cobalamin biosynthesis protein CbiD